MFGGRAAFQDPDFRPDYGSIVEIEWSGMKHEGKDISKIVEWRRLKDLPVFAKATANGKMVNGIRLFEDGVSPSDIKQGNLGDCWLLSSLACLSTRPGAIEKLFLTPEYNEEGRYQIRLWDKSNKRYKDITIDDNIPVWRHSGEPCFARPIGNEAWVLLLEKAMAKHVGNYHFLDGGAASWALEALTGHYTCMFLLDIKYGPNRGKPFPADWRWLRAEMAARPADRVSAFGGPSPSPVKRASVYLVDENDAAKYYDHDEVFMALVYHLAIGNLAAASTEGEDDGKSVQGVVRSHAYTVLAAQEVERSSAGRLRMVQVRNPHGAGGLEWTGAWSDASPLWRQHPEVARALGFTPSGSGSGSGGGTQDGIFWMEWADLMQHFKEITFCCTRGFDYVEDSKEGSGWVNVFDDPSFPHDHRSLGDYKFIYGGNPMTGKQLDDIIKWMRLKEIAAPEQFRKGTRGLKLFSGGIHCDDVDGSSSGLMVAAACLANKPGAIEEMFLTKEYKTDGAYQVRLYDPKTMTAVITPFDDWIPCFSGNAITKTRILGSEVWVLLLEKAVARMVESYSKVAMWGVQVCWALAAYTGEYTCLFNWDDGKKKWRRLELQYVDKDPGKYRAEYGNETTSLVDSERVFQTISAQLLMGCLVAAETDRVADTSASSGLAQGRYYSVLDARNVTLRTMIKQQSQAGQGSRPASRPASRPGSRPGSRGTGVGSSQREVKLIKLRDPARTNEWQGGWSDGSMLWEQHPEVREELSQPRDLVAAAGAAAGADGAGTAGAGSSGRRDGSFWMALDDFLLHFKAITMCGNSLKGNAAPWEVSPGVLERAARKLAEARRQQQLEHEQEALEETLASELKRRAGDRRQGGTSMASAAVFTNAAKAAAQQAPKKPPPAPPRASASGGQAAAAAAPAAAAVVGAAGVAAVVAASGGVGEGGVSPSAKPVVVVVDYKGCKACTIM